MKLDKYTEKTKIVLSEAQSSAVIHDNQIIEDLHLILALIQEDNNTIRQLISICGANGALRSGLSRQLRVSHLSEFVQLIKLSKI